MELSTPHLDDKKVLERELLPQIKETLVSRARKIKGMQHISDDFLEIAAKIAKVCEMKEVSDALILELAHPKYNNIRSVLSALFGEYYEGKKKILAAYFT